ncbi:MAG: hypothetical protein WCF23_16175 [Candidatus Nitrosopolaris sp.]
MHKNQIRFYHDIIDLVNDINMKKIRDFDTKYGIFEEVSEDILMDRDTYIAGLISKLKKR